MKLSYYHITEYCNMEHILKDGLIPNNGKVYLSSSLGRVLDMWDQMMEEEYKSDSPVILKVRINPVSLEVDEDSDFDCYFTRNTISKRDIKYFF